MVIGITVSNVLRNHLPKLEVVYRGMTEKEPLNPPVNPYELDVHYPTVTVDKEPDEFDENVVAYQQSDDYIDEWKDEDIKEFDVYKLIFIDACYEIFGNADETIPGIVKSVSTYAATSEHEFVITNMESARSKLATLYFLSKVGFDIKHLFFPGTREEMWERVDVLITDDPKTLALKPEGKKSIKVENDFNKTVDSDYTVTNIKEITTNLGDILKQVGA